jgi:hypothetical protein
MYSVFAIEVPNKRGPDNRGFTVISGIYVFPGFYSSLLCFLVNVRVMCMYQCTLDIPPWFRSIGT